MAEYWKLSQKLSFTPLNKDYFYHMTIRSILVIKQTLVPRPADLQIPLILFSLIILKTITDDSGDIAFIPMNMLWSKVEYKDHWANQMEAI